jgi:hypothetical protein
MRRLSSRHLLALWLVCSVAACSRGEIVDGVRDSAFVGAMAELQRIESTPGLDSAQRDAARRKALQGRGLTQAQLERAAAALADDPARARALFEAVAQRASGADTAGKRAAPSLPRQSTDHP